MGAMCRLAGVVIVCCACASGREHAPQRPLSFPGPQAAFAASRSALLTQRKQVTTTSLAPQSRLQPRLQARTAAPAMVIGAVRALPALAFSATMRKSTLLAFAVAACAVVLKVLKAMLDTPSRTYDKEANSVGREYDAWTEDGILEYYWGEHIHLGYYNDEEMKKGYKKKDFIAAKVDFIDEMFKWSDANQPKTVLDVGCGIGGTSRHLAKKLPEAQVTGITLSQAQVNRATALAEAQGVTNAKFQVTDALAMGFPDNSFDMIWACESGEHMPDKKKYVEEMTRVLKPGGHMVIATWCQRETPPEFNAQERKTLDFLYGEWTHPYFISIEEYGRLMEGTGALEKITTADWVKETIASWRHSIWVGVYDPWTVITKPTKWWKTIRDGVTLERMHRAFDCGLMQYGMMKAVKKAPAAA